MIKAIIVDDESAVRYAIRQLGDWKKSDIEIVGEAVNGLEAYEMALRLNPGLIITDMKMPGMDGMALMERLKVELPAVKFIVISGYDDFEYLKSAIYNQASDYILKPIDGELLNIAIVKVVKQLNSELHKHEMEFQKDIEIKHTRKLIDEKTLNMLIMGDNRIQNSSANEPLQASLKISSLEIPLLILMNCYNINEVIKNDFQDDRDLLYFIIENITEEILTDYDGVFFKTYTGKCELCIVISSKYKKPLNFNDDLNKLFRKIIDSINKYTGIQMIISVGKERRIIQDIKDSYIEAKQALMCASMYEKEDIYFYSEEGYSRLKNNINFLSMENEFVMAVEACDDLQINNIFERFFQRIENGGKINIGQMINIYKEIFFAVNKAFKRQDFTEMVDEFGQESIEEFVCTLLLSRSDLNQIKNYIVNKIKPYLQKIKENKKINSRKTLYHIKTYIDTYYFEEISLESLSKKYFISTCHLSRSFKEEFGSNITDYVIRIRMNKAMELLKEDNLKVLDVMNLTGFNNLNYFGKVFKKHFGMSPSEIKRS